MHPDLFVSTEHPLLAPPGEGRVRVRWCGTAAFELICDGHVVLVDPYATRAPHRRLFGGSIAPNPGVVDRVFPRADAIFVGHSHFDHLLDVPHIAARTGATVYGSPSTANVCAAAGLPSEQVVACRWGDVVETGPFRVTMLPSLHSRFALGHRAPYAGVIPATCTLPMGVTGYRVGLVFGLLIEVADRTLYHGGSANLIDGALAGHHADVLMICIWGRHATDRYVPRILDALRPRIVLPMHWDNFFRPYDAPTMLLPGVRFGALVDEIVAFDADTAIRTLPVGGALGLR